MKVSKKPRMLIAISAGSLVALISAFICLGVAATMILNNSLRINHEGVIIVGIHVLASLLGSIVSGALSDKPLISCASTLGVLLLFEIAATVFVYSGEFQNVLACLIGDLSGASTGLFLMVSTKNRKGKGIKKYRSR